MENQIKAKTKEMLVQITMNMSMYVLAIALLIPEIKNKLTFENTGSIIMFCIGLFVYSFSIYISIKIIKFQKEINKLIKENKKNLTSK